MKPMGTCLRLLRATALAMALLPATAGAQFFLKATGVPTSTLSTTAPTATRLANFDSGRDSVEGLTISKGGSGADESDDRRYQRWRGPTGGMVLSGEYRLTLWSAMKDFDTRRAGSVTAFLRDCSASTTACTTITTARLSLTNWSGGTSGWVERSIEFGAVNYTIGTSRLLEVKIIVDERSDDDMLFAYDTTAYPSRLSARSSAPVQAFRNGSFELSATDPGQFNTLRAGSTAITGWTVIGNDINHIGTYWTSSEGRRSVDLVGEERRGGVSQTFSTTPGTTYDVQFDLAGNPSAGPRIKPVTVSAAGISQSFTFDTSGRSTANMGWRTQTFTFTATDAVTTLSFLSDTGSDCCAGAALDNVRLTARTPVAAGGSFNAFEAATATGATSGVIQTKVSGTTFRLAIVALNAARTAVDTRYSGTASVTLLDARDNSGALDANGCRSSWVSISRSATSVTFADGSAGRVNAALVEGNAWRELRVRIAEGNRVGCSNDSFAVRPAGLVVSALDADWRTAYTMSGTPRSLNNTAAAGGVVHGAGHPFTVSASAVDTSGALLAGYDGFPTVRSGSPACVLPAGCTTGILSLPGWVQVCGGTMHATAATYSEVGTFTLQLEDSSFAAIDANDTDLATRTIPQSGGAATIGRFVPAGFELQPSGSAPLLRTMNATDASCSAAPTGTPRRSFTYVGQPFGFAVRPTATILPRNAAGALTVNYRGTLWKITSDHIVRQLAANDTTPAGQPVLVTIGGVAPGDVVSNGDGTGRVTTSALDSIQYTRNPTTPQAPFTARITTAVWISDTTEAGVTGNPSTIGSSSTRACFNGGGTCTVPGPGIAFDSAVPGFQGNEFRYGRLRLVNANGSEMIALPAPALAEHWNGSAWVGNTRDFCTAIDPARITLSNWQRNLQDGETKVASAGTLSAGRRSIVFLAPGAGNSGSVDLAIDLAAAGLPWLQGAWTGGNHDQNPSARATFGTASAPPPMIFRRERY